MIRISLCMIVKNEEAVIARCLDSVKDIVDEIVIVDTGSTDATKEIVKGYTDKIYDFKWVDNFSLARNYSFSKATMDYVMWLDADDVILEQDIKKLLQLKTDIAKNVDVVMMKYNTGFDEFGNVTLSYYRERLLKRNSNIEWHEPVHEYISTAGISINSDICITHKKMKVSNPERNLRIYEKLISQGQKLGTRGMFYYARELMDNQKVDEAINGFNLFLESGDGWLGDNITACYDLAKCYSRKNDKKAVLRVLYQSFMYDLPRAEICCFIGDIYLEQNDFDKAIFWFETAITLKRPTGNAGFVFPDYWDYIPCLQLCVCYYKMGNIQKSIYYNKKASTYKPKSQAVLYNNQFFDSYENEQIKIMATDEHTVHENIQRDTKFTRLNLGCGKNILDGWINVDCVNLSGVDVVADFDNCKEVPLPFGEDTVDYFYASHLLEHLNDPLNFMQELHRVAKPNATAHFRVPYGSSDDALEDITHKQQYFLNSFGYFTQPYYWRADYGYKGDWLVQKITLIVDKNRYYGKTKDEILFEVNTYRNIVREMVVELSAVKPQRIPIKELQEQPEIIFEFV